MIGQKIVNGIELISMWISQTMFNHGIESYCDLETTEFPRDGEPAYSLITNDGGMLSLFNIDGNSTVIGQQEQKQLDERIYEKFKGYLKEDGQILQIIYESDPYTVQREIHEALRPSANTAQRIGLEITDVLENQEKTLTHYCVNEACTLGIWTLPTCLPPDSIKRELKENAKAFKNKAVPGFSEAQSPLVAIQGLVPSHQSIKKAIEKDLRSFGLILTPLTAHEAVKKIRMSIDPDTVSKNWRASLPGDKINRRKEVADDISNLYYPTLASQLFNRRPQGFVSPSGMETVQIGKRLYAPLLFDVYPQEPKPFSELIERIDRNIPWRISFFIEPNGLGKTGLNKAILSVVGFIGTNKEIKKAFDDLYELEREGDPVVRMRIAMITWAEDPKTLEENCSLLTRAVQGWGVCDVTNDCGDPISGFVSSLPCLSKMNIAPPVFPPLADAIKMLPTARPASPWKTGAMLLRTPDGKLYPCQPGSSEQISWIDLIFGPMGSGKSVHLNRLNLAFCLQPGLSQLPLLAIIDVGPSSKGLISLLQEALPKDRAHEVGYFMLRNARECAINPFDTQLGCRYPTQYERDFLINFLTILGTPAGSETPFDSVSDLAGVLVDGVYEIFSDFGNNRPKLYERDRNQEIDRELDEIAYITDAYTTWWNVVDILAEHKRYFTASQAQRYAVPILSDLMEVLKSNKVRDIFEPTGGKPLLIRTGEKLTDAMSRVITTTIKNYILLAGETQFNTGACRVFSIDLNEVAKGQGAEGEKRAAIMFMLAKHLSARNFFINPGMAGEFKVASPEMYHQYHEERAQEIFQTPKLLALDELHRAGRIKNPAFMNSLIQDGREGRKNNLLFSLASQLLEDFPEDIVRLGSSFYVLKSNDAENTDQIAKRFNLNNEAKRFLTYECNGPVAGHGANFIGIFKTRKGLYSQALTSTIGSIELWAFNTTNEDMNLREHLYKLVTPSLARRLLAKRFPSGSAKKEIEKRKERMGVRQDDDAFDIIKQLSQEILDQDNS
jgi:intracellular multiplication protein IcmB